MRIYILFLILLLVGCGGKEDMPQARSTSTVTMSGSYAIPITGITDETLTARSPTPDIGFALQPISFVGGYAAVDLAGTIHFFSLKDSLLRSAKLLQPDLLLSFKDKIVAVTSNGDCEAIGTDGVLHWRGSVEGSGGLNAVIAGGKLVVSHGNNLAALDLATGAPRWQRQFRASIFSLAASDGRIALLLTKNQFDAADSLVEIDSNGNRRRVIALRGERVVSNLAMLSDGGFTFGTIGAAGPNGRNRSVWLFNQEGKKVWRHALSFTPSHIAAANGKIFASGVDYRQSDAAGFITAFREVDTLTQWQRTFSLPLSTTPVVSNDNVYFAVAFSSEAVVSTRGLFFTLNAENGKTLSERAIKGAEEGFLPGPAMPDDLGRLLLASRGEARIYILDRSTFQRVF